MFQTEDIENYFCWDSLRDSDAMKNRGNSPELRYRALVSFETLPFIHHSGDGCLQKNEMLGLGWFLKLLQTLNVDITYKKLKY